ncbi:MAG: imidazole glycerol phosphate synthase subunit HisH [Gammaproteobacteria bacterium]|nr:MAG: imidazole glycerol phosphate synthase subunit HisH [Gammaproteobacteria bacterium]
MSGTKVAVIDYGMGNLHSVAKALEHADSAAQVTVTHEAQQIRQADRVVFPGVGALADCMVHLRERDLTETVLEASRNKPFLGICLGMQALLDSSEEGQTEQGPIAALGRLTGQVLAFPEDEMRNKGLKVPHMGWNRVYIRAAHPLWQGIASGCRFYFVHSYYAKMENESDVSATTDYGLEFASVLAHENLFAVQFHPEKSHRDGLRLLANFMKWNGEGA